jgi:hypothetical protein
VSTFIFDKRVASSEHFNIRPRGDAPFDDSAGVMNGRLV